MIFKMKRIKKEDYFQKNYCIFLDSFKDVNMNVVFMMFYDILFLLVSSLLVYFTLSGLLNKVAAFNLPTNFLDLDAAKAGSLMNSVRGFFYLIVLIIVFLVFLITLIWSLFKAINWSIAVKKKFSSKKLLRFSFLNLAWFSILILLMVIASIAIDPNAVPAFIFTILAVAAYLTSILYVLFFTEKSPKVIKKAVSLSFKKIHYFILPYGIIALFLYFAFKILSLINLQPREYLIVSVLAFTAILAWSRLYLVRVVRSVKSA